MTNKQSLKQTHTDLLDWPDEAFSRRIRIYYTNKLPKETPSPSPLTFTRITKGKDRVPTKKVHIKFEKEGETKALLISYAFFLVYKRNWLGIQCCNAVTLIKTYKSIIRSIPDYSAIAIIMMTPKDKEKPEVRQIDRI
eukprot:Pgem_evm1s165